MESYNEHDVKEDIKIIKGGRKVQENINFLEHVWAHMATSLKQIIIVMVEILEKQATHKYKKKKKEINRFTQ